ncbi:hypothetical protein Aperf_G00000074830 [Anoplocephala perfoliata]
MSDQENTDAWSSDGDSVSSDSISSDSDTFSSEETKGARYLKQAGIFTREGVVDQAIDRWSAYSHLCDRSIASLRDTMIDSYVKEAVEAKSRLNPTQSTDSNSANVVGKLSTAAEISALSKTLPRNSQRLAEVRALRRIGRPSKRAENAKHLAATTQFAIFSSHLAPWRPMSALSQKCQYRDPTISTWEYKCAKPSIPLLPYCAEHLVLFEETHRQTTSITTPAAVGSSPSKELDTDAEGSNSLATSPVAASTVQKPVASAAPAKSTPISSRSETGKPQKPSIKKTTTSKARSATDGNAGQSEIQFPPQYLFRKCGGGPNNDCPQPVIAFTHSTRCSLHTTVSTLFSSTVKKEESLDMKPEQEEESPTNSSLIHPLLLQYLKKRRLDQSLH